MKKKRLTSLLLCVVLLFSLLPMQTFAAGKVNYALSSTQNTLEVTGSGAVTQIDVKNLGRNYKDVKELVIGEGITLVEHNAFSEYLSLTKVTYKGKRDVVVNGTLAVPVASIYVPAEYEGTSFGGKPITKKSGSGAITTVETVITVFAGQTHYVRIGTDAAISASSANSQIARAEMRGENLKITGVNASSTPVDITLEKAEDHQGGMKYRVRVTNFSISGPARVDGGNPVQLTTNAADATSKPSVTWTSGNTNIARVDSDGVVTPVGNGRVTITAEAVAEGFHATSMLVMEVSMTAAHDGGPYHQCEYEYYKEDSHTIGAKCECGALGMVKISAPNNLAYNGKEKKAVVSTFQWPVDLPKVTYNDVDRVNVTDEEIEAKIKVGRVTAKVKYTIVKANIKPVVTMEDWVYGETASDPVLTGNPGGGKKTFTYKALNAPKFTKTKPSAVGTYIVKATVKATKNYNGAEATATFNILKPSPNYTAPKAIENLQATGDPLALVTAGSVKKPKGVKMEYSLDGKNWSKDVPTATDAGEYTVYWRIPETEEYASVKGEVPVIIIDVASRSIFENQAYDITLSGSAKTVEAEEKGVVSAEIKGSVLTITGVKQGTETVTVKNGDGDVLAIYNMTVEKFNVVPDTITLEEGKTSGLETNAAGKVIWDSNDKRVAVVSEDGTVLAKRKGRATVTAVDEFGNTDSCKIEVIEHVCQWTCRLEGQDTIVASCTCGKSGKAKISAPADLVYNGKTKDAAVTTENWPGRAPKVEYNNVHRTDVTGKAIEATIKAGKGKDTVTATVSYTITKANPTYTAPEAVKDLEQDGTSKKLITAGTVTAPKNTKMEYSLDGHNWDTDIPEKSQAGTYKVYWRIAETKNYKGASGDVTVTIERKQLKVTPAEVTLKVNESKKLETNLPGKTTWKSSNDKIAAVGKDGKVTAKAPGTATITVTVGEGFWKQTAECKVTVIAKGPQKPR